MKRRAATPRMPGGTIFTRLLVTISMVAAVPAAGLGCVQYLRDRQAAVEQEQSRLEQSCQRLADQIDAYLGANRELARHLAATEEVRGFLGNPDASPADVAACNAWLCEQEALTAEVLLVFVVDGVGVCRATSLPDTLGVDYTFREYVRRALAGESCTSDWLVGAVTQVSGLMSAAPVVVDGSIRGALIVKTSTEPITDAVEARTVEGRIAYVIDHRGIILAHGHPRHCYTTTMALSEADQAQIAAERQFGQRRLRPYPMPPEFGETVRRVIADGGPPRAVRYPSEGMGRQASLVRSTEQPWAIGCARPEADIYARSRILLRDTLASMALVLVLVVAASLVLSRWLAAPLGRLSEAARRLGGGDLEARADSSSYGEIGALAGSFNRMADQIAAHTSELEAKVRERTLELESLNRDNLRTVEELQAALGQVRTLHGLLPICSACKRIRDDQGYWTRIEAYISEHSDAEFTHGICPECVARLYPGLRMEPENPPGAEPRDRPESEPESESPSVDLPFPPNL